VFLDIRSQAGNLFELILGRNRNEDRFVEAATDKLDLARLDKLPQADEIFRPMLLDPGEQRPGIMQAETHSRMPFDMFNEGKVGSGVGLFEDMLEIAARLMGVDEKREMKFLRHGDSFFSLIS
jgi:hypothetical protein